MKVAALTAGGAALAGACSSPASRTQAPAFDPNDSYWALEQPVANPPLAEDMAVDVAIIGGGYTGLSTAPFIPPEPFRWIGVQGAMKYYDWQDKR